jgi:hypothetical protein
LLRAEKCTEIQGYLVSKPRPANEISTLIDDFARTGRHDLFRGRPLESPRLAPLQQSNGAEQTDGVGRSLTVSLP